MKHTSGIPNGGRHARRACVAAFLLFLAALLPAQNILKDSWRDVAEEMRPQILAAMEQAKTVGMTIVLVDGDEVVWSEGFGHSDLAAGRKADADTMFEIGSVSKTFSGLMVMQLAEQGRIDIDRPVADYIPGFRVGPTARDFPRNDRPITVRDLMAHHSGLPGDLVNGAFTVSPNKDFNKRLLAWLAEDNATYPPGYRWAYSNTAVALLQNVIESSSGKGFDDYSDQFLASMGMAPASYHKADPALLARLSKGYAGSSEFPTTHINIPASGSIVASANQMGRYLRMLLGKGAIDGKRIVRPETLSAMTTRQYPGLPLDLGIEMGLSFILSDTALSWAGPLFWHNGATLTFRSHLEVLPERGLAVMAIANSTGSDLAVANAAKASLTTALRLKRGLVKPEPVPSPAPIPASIPAHMLENIAGVYVGDDHGAYDRFTPAENGLSWKTGPAGPDGALKDEGTLRLWSDGLFRTAADAPLAYEFKEAGGRMVFVRHANGSQIVFGERFAPKPLSAAWKARIGSWTANDADKAEVGYTMGEIPVFRLGESEGMLILDNDTTRFVLEPVSDTLAAVCGLGRFGGLTVRVSSGADGRERLKFMLVSYGRKEADKSAFRGPPAALPGLSPVAAYGEARAYRTSVGGYPVLSLRGTWREMGRQYGALLGVELREFHAAMRADLERRGLKPEHIESIRSTFQTYTPEMKELVEGMAETSGLSFEDHMLLDASFYLLPGFVIEGAMKANACSGIAVSRPRTEDGALLFARNWDMTPDAMRPYLKYIALVAFNPTGGGYSFANVRPLGQVYVETAVNEKGVLVELNNGSGSDPRGNPDARFSVASLFDFIRTSGSLDEMIGKLRSTRMDASYLIQAASAERAVSVEIPTFDSRVVEGKDGVLYALNHFSRPTYEPWKGKITELPSNAHDDRQVVLDKLFASPEWARGVGLDTVKKMMDLTVDKGGPVVANPTFGTVLQVIAIPRDMRVLFRGYGHSGWADLELVSLFD